MKVRKKMLSMKTDLDCSKFPDGLELKVLFSDASEKRLSMASCDAVCFPILC